METKETKRFIFGADHQPFGAGCVCVYESRRFLDVRVEATLEVLNTSDDVVGCLVQLSEWLSQKQARGLFT